MDNGLPIGSWTFWINNVNNIINMMWDINKIYDIPIMYILYLCLIAYVVLFIINYNNK